MKSFVLFAAVLSAGSAGATESVSASLTPDRTWAFSARLGMAGRSSSAVTPLAGPTVGASVAWNPVQPLGLRLLYGAAFLGNGTQDVRVSEVRHELAALVEGRLRPQKYFYVFLGAGPGIYVANISTRVLGGTPVVSTPWGAGVAWDAGIALLFKYVELRFGTGGLVRAGGHDQNFDISVGWRL